MKLPFKMRVWTPAEDHRYKTFWTKEPETIAWIEAFTKMGRCWKGGMFIDIGANVGIYSLYAASLYPQAIIIAIEPQLENFKALVLNILVNDFSNIIPVYAGVSGTTEVGSFASTSREIGSATGQIKCDQMDPKASRLISDVNYQCRLCPSYNLYDFCNSFGFPDFIKIDVDGGEYDILENAMALFKHQELRSMLIEFNKKDDRLKPVISSILEKGFVLSNDFNNHPEHSSIRRKKEGIQVENIIFTRE